MTVRTIYVVLLFLLPFAAYALYLRFRPQSDKRSAASHPWTVLVIAGLALVAASFVFWGVFENANQRGVYVPPHLEDGRLVPGRVIPESEQTSKGSAKGSSGDRVETGGRQ
jgi:hypothetical protein